MLAYVLHSLSAQLSSELDVLESTHRQYVNQIGPGVDRSEAERRYSLALGRRNLRRIETSPDRKRLEELDMWVSNITKGACRVADYAFPQEETRIVMMRKAESLANLTIEGVISETPVPRPSSQAQAWTQFRRGRGFHRAHEADIRNYEPRGGYSVKQFHLEYESLGVFAEKLFKAAAPLEVSQRRHVFALVESLFRLTMGEDPLGY